MEDLQQMLKRARLGLILLICLALLMGTVFLSLPFRNHRVEESEAFSVTAEYCGYYIDTNPKHTSIQEIDLHFNNHDDLTVDGCCVKMEWVSKLDTLPKGTTMHLLVHPRSGNVLQVEANGEIILPFQDTQRSILQESLTFAAIGLAMYASIGAFLVYFLHRKSK